MIRITLGHASYNLTTSNTKVVVMTIATARMSGIGVILAVEVECLPAIISDNLSSVSWPVKPTMTVMRMARMTKFASGDASCPMIQLTLVQIVI